MNTALTQIKSLQKWLFNHRKDLVVIVIIFFIALGVRLLYQNASVVNGPQRADAGKYVRAAANLRFFNAHSLQGLQPDNKPPETRTDLSPGFPLFLSLFVNSKNVKSVKSGNEYYTLFNTETVNKILFWQAILGALTTVLAFILARFCLAFRWSVLAGLLVAINPHLIALDGYLLTETLSIFVVTLSLVVLITAWRTNNYVLIFIGSLLICSSVHIRTVSYGLPVLMFLLLFLNSKQLTFHKRKRMVLNAVFFLLGVLSVYSVHRNFKQTKMTLVSSAISSSSDPKNKASDSDTSQIKYVVFKSPIEYLKNGLTPPNFIINGTSHVLAKNTGYDYKSKTTSNFKEKPMAYIQWNAVSKFIVMWHWDNAYNGDVYIYPMKKKGFEENHFLNALHWIMFHLHWVFYFLAWIAPFIFAIRFKTGLATKKEIYLIFPILIFTYYIAILWFLGSWLPRYTIIIRPYAAILSVASLSWIMNYDFKTLLMSFKNIHDDDGADDDDDE